MLVIKNYKHKVIEFKVFDISVYILLNRPYLLFINEIMLENSITLMTIFNGFSPFPHYY